jgi:hypothetical protein
VAGDFWKHDELKVQMVDDNGLYLLTLTIGATFSPALRDRSEAGRPDGNEQLQGRPSAKELPRR